MHVDLGPGAVALSRGDVEAAISGFGETLRHDPDNLAVRMALGDTQFRARQYCEAVETYWSVLERDPVLTSSTAPAEEELDDALANALFAWATLAPALRRRELMAWLARYRMRFGRRTEDLRAAELALRS